MRHDDWPYKCITGIMHELYYVYFANSNRNYCTLWMSINILHTRKRDVLLYAHRSNVFHNETFFLLFAGATGLKDLTINVPSMVRSGDTVTLSCHYDLEGLRLYSIQWFFNDHEFYRFIPDRKSPPFYSIFNVTGIKVNVSNLSVNIYKYKYIKIPITWWEKSQPVAKRICTRCSMEHYIFYRKISLHDVKNLSELFI